MATKIAARSLRFLHTSTLHLTYHLLNRLKAPSSLAAMDHQILISAKSSQDANHASIEITDNANGQASADDANDNDSDFCTPETAS